MVREEQIRQVAQRIGRKAKAERVLLFGSYARGDATEQSDVDLMVVAESDLPRFKRSPDLYKLVRPHPFSMDLVVYTPEEIEKGRKSKVSFVSRVLREGRLLYDRGS